MSPEFLTVPNSPPGSTLLVPGAAGSAADPMLRSATPMPSLADPRPFAIAKLGFAMHASPLETATGSKLIKDGDVILYKPFFSEELVLEGAVSRMRMGLGDAQGRVASPPGELPKALPGHDAPVPLYLERAGPREKLFFEPSKVVAGIVTCGGLCPGLNNVIRGLVQCLFYRYQVKRVLGFRYGYEGLNPKVGLPPMELTPSDVKDAHRFGGSMLGTSRGPQDPKIMLDYLMQLGVNVLFTVGGDGTQKGAHAIVQEAEARGYQLSVIGVPKTIDNDVAYCAKTFGFETAVSMSLDPIQAAHEEARSARGGIGIVKLMGRDSGFIALHATLASGDVNLLLIPEVSFSLQRVFAIVEDRLRSRDHIVIVVAEGAGQDVIAEHLRASAGAAGSTLSAKDASGNAKLQDVGVFLKDAIGAHLKKRGVEHTIKYIDPSYTIRTQPACATDSVFTVSLAQNAVHAALAGMTDAIVGLVQDEFVLIPIMKAVERRKKVDPASALYQTVLDHTGMPRDLVN